MAGMGPPPKPADQRRRRNAVPGTVYLPAEGRLGDPPRWPLASMTVAEEGAWAELWASPQAVAWERLAVPERVIARYCRIACAAESALAGTPTVAGIQMVGEARQLEQKLGLTPEAMLRLRWEVVADELAEARSDVAPPAPVRRIRAVEG